MFSKLYTRFVGSTTLLGAGTGLYYGCKMANMNYSKQYNYTIKDIIGETMCYSMVVLGNTMNGATLGCICGATFPLSGFAAYQLYSQIKNNKTSTDEVEEMKKEINLYNHPYNQLR